MVYKYLYFFILIIAVLLFPQRAYASENFTTDYSVLYSIKDTGDTKANFSVTLTNTTPQFFASSYKMKLGFDDIRNFKAADEDGDLEVNLKKIERGYEAELFFNKKVIGVGSELPFTIVFDTNDIAQKLGEVWEVNIPGVAGGEEFDNFTVQIEVPDSFGQASFIKPLQDTESLVFDKKQLGNSGISMTFGEKQMLDFTLDYYLQNSNIYPVKSEIALPPSTNYQDIFINKIEPEPNNVRLDKDGNWIAEYSLRRNEEMTVKVSGQAKLFLTPKKIDISQDEKEKYTKATGNWQADDTEIKKLANDLRTPDKIYKYVVDTLSYDFSGVSADKNRLGAAGSLSKPDEAVCREFTDLFIAIARAAGIPAREINGYAHTKNSTQRPLSLAQDVLHAWPEYYDSERKTWVMIDPTWGSTTGGVDYFDVLDLNHFVFVRKGIDDNYPIPAGGYKLKNEKDKKYIKVSSTEKELDTKQSFDIRTSVDGTQIAGSALNTKITITNTGHAFIPPQTLGIDSDTLTPENKKVDVPGVPPFGRVVLDTEFERTDPLTNTDAEFKISYSDKTYNQEVLIAPFFMTLPGIGGVLFAIFSLILLITAAKARRLRLQK